MKSKRFIGPFGLFVSFTVLVVLVAPQGMAWEAIWAQASYEPEVGTHIHVDEQGNVYVAGWAWVLGRGDDDLIVIKYGSSGTELWDYQYDAGLNNALGFDHPVGVGTDAQGNVYVAGKARFQRSGLQDYDYVTIKLDSSGDEQWTRYYDYTDGSSDHGDDTAADMHVDEAGNVWVYGESDGGYATVKYNSAGVEQWVARYDGDHVGANSLGGALAVDRFGNAVVTGASQDDITYAYDYVTLKYNSSGAEQWRARYGLTTAHAFKPTDVAVDAQGNVAVTGCTEWGPSEDVHWDMTTVYYTSAGTQVWDHTFSGTGYDSIYDDKGTAVAFDHSGNVIAAGWATMDGNATDYVVVKYARGGSELWQRTYNVMPGSPGTGNSLDYAYAVAVDAGNHVHVVGRLAVDWQGLGEDESYGLLSYSPEGDLVDVVNFDNDPALPFTDEALAVAVNASGVLAVTGSAFGSASFEDIGTFTVAAQGLFCDAFEPGDSSRWSATVGN